MMSSKNNGFTASDIERYHSGKMSPEERHALEKASLDDPFLADALEGYAFTSTPSRDLAKIQARLEEKINGKKVVPFFQKYKWLSVAAMVLIIAGVSWLTYTVSKNTNNTVAVQREKQPANDSNLKMPEQTIVGDSNKTYSTSLVEKKLNKTENRQTTQLKSPKQSNASDNQKRLEEVTITNSKQETERTNQLSLKEKTFSATQNEIAGRQNKVPVNEGYMKNTERFSNNNNAISSEPSATNLSKARRLNSLPDSTSDNSSAIRVRGTVPNDSVKNLNIVLHPLPMDSLQTVVIGYGSQKKSGEKYPRVTIDTLEPAEGYVNFDDYVVNNLKMPEELKNKPTAGEVQLSFDVDQNGQPTNITVVKSLCQKCDEEAIRLLKEGPKWKQKKNKKGKITFRF